MSILLKNALYLKSNCADWEQADILIEDSQITKIGSYKETWPIPEEVINCKGKVVIPGLINAHAHSYTGYLKGTIDNVPLDIYMLYAIAGGAFRTEREIYVSSALVALNMLKRGTTAAVDHFAQRPVISAEGLSASAEGFKSLGMRTRIASMFADKSFFDTVPMLPGELPADVLPNGSQKPQSVNEYISEVEKAYCRYRNDPLTGIILGTDGPQRCSDELLIKTGQLEEKYHMGWQTHILEAKTQALVARQLYGMDLIQHMDQIGVLNERTALVHHIWVSDAELELVKKHNATIVHCPSSNLHLGSGVAPVDRYVKMGIHIALGSDGGNCGSIGILEQVKLMALLHNVSHIDYQTWFSAEDALRTAYQGGSRLFRENIGRIEPGCLADITIIDIDNVFWQPVNNLTRQLVYYEDGSNVDTVIINGQKVLEHGTSTLIDEAELIVEAKEIAEKLRRNSTGSLALVEKQIPYFRKMYLREMKRDIGYNRLIRGD